jgi:hypothetical protein
MKFAHGCINNPIILGRINVMHICGGALFLEKKRDYLNGLLSSTWTELMERRPC